MAASGSSCSPRRNSMSSLARLAAALPVAALLLPARASAQATTVIPDQMSTICPTNRDVHHIVCASDAIAHGKLSGAQDIAAERAGRQAWVKSHTKEVVSSGTETS